MHKYLPVFQAKQGKDPRMILMLVITSNRNKYLSINVSDDDGGDAGDLEVNNL